MSRPLLGKRANAFGCLRYAQVFKPDTQAMVERRIERCVRSEIEKLPCKAERVSTIRRDRVGNAQCRCQYLIGRDKMGNDAEIVEPPGRHRLAYQDELQR